MRSLARWGSLPLVAWPLGSWALGLGEIEPNSWLNQPLDAEIALTATPAELQSLSVSLAPVEDFVAAGLDYPTFLASIEFSVGVDESGQNVIFVSSTEAITEPFLTMIVQVSSSGAGFSREYTVLLDPPLFQPEAAAVEPITAPAPQVQEPAGGAIVRQPTPAPVQAPPAAQQAQPQAAPAAAPQAPPPAAAAGGDYTVQAGDTLWGIASRNRPAGVTMNQAMMSIFEANPAAFEGNINRLRRGAILRIPPAATLGSIAAAAATAEVQRQIDEWRAGLDGEARLALLPPSEEVLSEARAHTR